MATIQVGIDLGTTNTLVYGKHKGKIAPVKFRGGVTLPSVLYADVEEGGKIKVGRVAKQREYADPKNGIHSSKTYMGNNHKTWTIGGEKFPQTFTPTEVATRILSEVYDAVKSKYNLEDGDVIQAIITVPAYFTANQCDETKKAGQNAGFEVLRIIKEPVAAAYNINPKDDGLICVVDLGGGTFDVSVVDKQNYKYSVRGIDGNKHLGGDDFDKKLAQRFLDDIQDDLDIDLSSLEASGLEYEEYNGMMGKIRKEAVNCKEELSDQTEKEVIINDLFHYGPNKKPYHYDVTITRNEFNELCADLYQEISDVLHRLIDDNSRFRKEDIRNVYLVGGSCYIPKVREVVEEYFGFPVNFSNGLEEQVAQGAAKIADGYNTPVYSENREDPFADRLEDITSHSLGLRIRDSRFSEIIPEGTPYPCKLSDTFTTIYDNQEYVIIEVCEKINKFAGENVNYEYPDYELYGSFILSGIEKASAGKPQIEVTFNYDLSCTLSVTAMDKTTGATRTVTLKKGEIVEAPSSVRATDFMVAIDISGSMDNNSRIYEAKNACTKLRNNILDLNVHGLGIITFGSYANCVCNLTHNKSDLLAAVKRISTTGSTNMAEAISLANKYLSDSENNKAIIIITDGYPDDGSSTQVNARKAKNNDISIATIGVQDADMSFLKTIATGSDLCFMVHDLGKLADTFGQAVQNLLSK